MRLMLSTAVLALVAGGAFAEEITARASLSDVTLMSQGALVTRVVTLEAGAGSHELTLEDLPPSFSLQGLRIAGSAPVSLGGLRLEEAPHAEAVRVETPAVTEARDAVAAAKAALEGDEAALAGLRARAEAAEAQVALLGRLGGPDTPPADLAALLAAVSEGVVKARAEAAQALAEAARAETALAAKRAALAQAETDLAEAEARARESRVLHLTVEKGEGPVTLSLTSYAPEASWQPSYEASLTRGANPALTLTHIAAVSQETGEDWAGVRVTLSTAQLDQQMQTSLPWEFIRRIYEPQKGELYRQSDMAMSAAPAPEAMPVVASESVGGVVMQGQTVTYVYETPVTVASGGEAVRLKVAEESFAPEVFAMAVPAQDETAFLVARAKAQLPLLGGDVIVTLDGAMIGGTTLEPHPSGDEVDFAFGAVQGLKITRVTPDRMTGEQGFIRSENAQRETLVLRAENLTGEAWPVRMYEALPVSEQEDLVIGWKAEPAPTAENVKDRRGVAEWRFDLAPGARQEVTLTYDLSWPKGQELE